MTTFITRLLIPKVTEGTGNERESAGQQSHPVGWAQAALCVVHTPGHLTRPWGTDSGLSHHCVGRLCNEAENTSVLRGRQDENVALLFISYMTLGKFLIYLEFQCARLKIGVNSPECGAKPWGRGFDGVVHSGRCWKEGKLERCAGARWWGYCIYRPLQNHCGQGPPMESHPSGWRHTSCVNLKSWGGGVRWHIRSPRAFSEPSRAVSQYLPALSLLNAERLWLGWGSRGVNAAQALCWGGLWRTGVSWSGLFRSRQSDGRWMGVV